MPHIACRTSHAPLHAGPGNIKQVVARRITPPGHDLLATYFLTAVRLRTRGRIRNG